MDKNYYDVKKEERELEARIVRIKEKIQELEMKSFGKYTPAHTETTSSKYVSGDDYSYTKKVGAHWDKPKNTSNIREEIAELKQELERLESMRKKTSSNLTE